MSDLLSTAKERLSESIREVTQLRFSVELPTSQSTPQEVLDTLLEVRRNLDRIEELLLRTGRLKAEFTRSKLAAEAVTEEAWAHASQRSRRRTVVNGTDFVAPRERYADCDLEVLPQRQSARLAGEVASVAEEAYDYISTARRGLDGTRQDLLTILRTLQFESSLER